jgi:hypothetical protein
LASLARKHTAAEIEAACATAHSFQAYRLRTVRKLIGQTSDMQQSLEFIDEHPTIRPMSEYGDLVRDVFAKEALS